MDQVEELERTVDGSWKSESSCYLTGLRGPGQHREVRFE
jgi:hypothetical protein